jgi:CHAT domain-containing protein
MKSLAAGGISLFQYAGHASFVGLDGWESQLGREGSPLMTIGDILTLPAAPDHAILSGCETGTSAETSGAGLGLAQAFVIAGTEWVVASSRVVKDSDAARIVVDLFDQRVVHPDSDIGFLLRAVQRELLEAEPQIDWSSFRVSSLEHRGRVRSAVTITNTRWTEMICGARSHLRIEVTRETIIF